MIYRFLTKYLVVRLEDHLVNEKAVLKTRQEELLVARTNLRSVMCILYTSKRPVSHC